ncbi:MAG: tetratricopeptide repeat protein [Desulfomonile tiedjei]|nr:tetratricopeptide repeat protein [Desulfomonile tiedjei]
MAIRTRCSNLKSITLILCAFIMTLSLSGNSTSQPPPPAAAKKPPQGQLHLDKAKRELERKQYALAIRSLSAVIRSDPGSAEAHRLRGVAYEKLGLFKRAEEDFTRYIERSPSDPNGYIMRGDTRNFEQEYGAALEDYNAALKLSPSSVTAYLGRGLALAGLGKYDEAIKAYQWVLTKQPGNVEALENIGRACMLAGRHLEASTYLERALEHETDPAWRSTIGKWKQELVRDATPEKPKARGPSRGPTGDKTRSLW